MGASANGRRVARWVACTTVAVAVLASSAETFAYRPLITEDAAVAGKGEGELELGFDHLHWRGGDMENALLLVPIYGVTENAQLAVETPFRFLDPADGASVGGVGDVAIVGKVRLIGETPRLPAFALRGTLKTASGSERHELGTGTWDLGFAVVATKTLAPVTLHAMLGYTIVLTHSDRFQDVHVFGLAIDWKVVDRWHLVGEIAGNGHPERRAGPDPASGLIGVIHDVTEKIAIDFGLRTGFNDSLPRWTISTGVSFCF
jgi:outer membrane putative beta-barrel porin/alpha-amylase